LFYLLFLFSPNHNPTWREAYRRFGTPVTSFDQFMLINNDLLLATYLLSHVSLQTMPDDIDRVTFLQDLQMKLAERKTSEETEPKVALLWGFLIMSGAHIMKRSDASKKQLLILARFFHVNVSTPEGWGDGLLGAIGLKRDSQSNKKKILLRCFSCAIFALFTKYSSDPLNSSSSSEYENAMSELKNALSNKKFADVRLTGLQAISLIENKKESMLDMCNDTISALIRMFYQESYLNSIEFFLNW
jgi:ectopic P granules protein 5